MNIEASDKFYEYPEIVRARLFDLRTHIFKVASRLELGEVEETLKWGEPSFKVRSGSPVRIDWKSKTPEKYYLFFNCNTKLVDTYRELFSDELVYEGNRAIVLEVSKPPPEETIERCLTLALTYQKIKHLPLLGE